MNSNTIRSQFQYESTFYMNFQLLKLGKCDENSATFKENKPGYLNAIFRVTIRAVGTRGEEGHVPHPSILRPTSSCAPLMFSANIRTDYMGAIPIFETFLRP